jgi:penicillin amidase
MFSVTVKAEPLELPGLMEPAKIVRDAQGIAHLRANNAHDLYYLAGWVHARDRLFQMDMSRRQPGGTLAELFGPSALPGDVEVRTIGLRRAAERSAAALSEESITALEAYAQGVNDWVLHGPGLPPEYAALGFTDRNNFRPWDVVDSIVIGKAISFGLSFTLDAGQTEALNAYVENFGAGGAIVFTQDVFRFQPFDCASTIPDATGEYPFIPVPGQFPNPESCLDPLVTSVVKDKAKTRGKFLDGIAGARTPTSAILRDLGNEAATKLRRSEFIRNVLDADGTIGSNAFGATRALGINGRPIIANDPHLPMQTPSTLYPIGLEAPGLNVFGSSFPGIPFVVLGHNKHIHWGAATNPMDVTDTYVELLVFDENGMPGATLYQGVPEPVQLVPEQFFFNGGGSLVQAPPGNGIPAFTIIVPRRNNGPVIATLEDPAPNAVIPALSVQYTGFSATRELDTFRIMNKARNLKHFQESLLFLDVGSQNWIYADIMGNMAIFSSAEMPIRTDLQAGFVAPGSVPGIFPPNVPVPPWLIRDGTSGSHEWLPVENPQPGQAVPHEILPLEEMPHTINPHAGWLVNANNDPAGTTLDNDPLNQLRRGGQGIYYLSSDYVGGFRAGAITRRVRELVANHGMLSAQNMQAIQADVSLHDARFFVPYILEAFNNARQDGKPEILAELSDDERVAEAVERLANWDFTAPTGIQAGYDAGDPVVPDWTGLPDPEQKEIDHSVAATIYSMWRGQAVRSIVDEPLGSLPKPASAQAMTSMQHLLRTEGGTGIVDFFDVPGLDAFADQRDYKLLSALQAALDLLADDRFAAAFSNSTNQEDYRWGKLHRIVFDHPFIEQASIPPQPPGGFPQPVPGLPGFPTDGGFSVVDGSSHSARADDLNDFMFGGFQASELSEFIFSTGPVRRYVGEPHSSFGSLAESIWAGGTSGVPFPDNPFYANLLPYWLTNNTLPLVLRAKDAEGGINIDVMPAN